MDLVIARHSEDISWIEGVPSSYDIHVMNSGTPIVPGSRAFTQESIHDAGVESYAYIQHILKKYDKLAEHTCFIQGNPFDHAAANMVDAMPKNFIELLKVLPNALGDDLWFVPLGNWVASHIDERAVFRMARTFPRSRHVIYNMHSGRGTNGEEVLTPLHPFKDLLGYILRPIQDSEMPRDLWYSWGNQFAVHRDAILNFKPEFWARFAGALEHAPKPLEGTLAERLWHAIFTEGFKRVQRASA